MSECQQLYEAVSSVDTEAVRELLKVATVDDVNYQKVF